MKDILIALITNSSWPLTVFVCFFLIRKEISILISKIKGVKAGSVELLLIEELRNTDLSEQQLKALAHISSEEIDLFLLASYSESIGFTYDLPIARDVFVSRIRTLHEAGLLEAYNLDSETERVVHKITPLGFEVRSLLLKGAKILLKESAVQSNA